MTPDELIALGLYDPDEPGAAERLELLQLSLDHGATLAEIREAIAENRLHAVAALRVVEGGTERLTVDEVAARAGMSVDEVRRLWRSLGFVDPEPGAQPFTERDVELFRAFGMFELGSLPGVSLQLARVMGSALARVADAEVAIVRADLEAPLRAEGAGNVDVARDFLRTAQNLMPLLEPALDTVHRHHVAVAGRRYALWGVPPTPQSTTEAVIGFADLVGFTALAQRRTATELDELVARFEQLVVGVLARPDARLVKLIGDEAMFAVGDAEEAVAVARALLAAVDADPMLPSVRIGLAAGEVLAREGDLFGPVVNLASRLVALARPGQAVLDAETARRLGSAVPIVALGPRPVAGFEEPVEVFAL